MKKLISILMVALLTGAITYADGTPSHGSGGTTGGGSGDGLAKKVKPQNEKTREDYFYEFIEIAQEAMRDLRRLEDKGLRLVDVAALSGALRGLTLPAANPASIEFRLSKDLPEGRGGEALTFYYDSIRRVLSMNPAAWELDKVRYRKFILKSEVTHEMLRFSGTETDYEKSREIMPYFLAMEVEAADQSARGNVHGCRNPVITGAMEKLLQHQILAGHMSSHKQELLGQIEEIRDNTRNWKLSQNILVTTGAILLGTAGFVKLITFIPLGATTAEWLAEPLTAIFGGLYGGGIGALGAYVGLLPPSSVDYINKVSKQMPASTEAMVAAQKASLDELQAAAGPEGFVGFRAKQLLAAVDNSILHWQASHDKVETKGSELFDAVPKGWGVGLRQLHYDLSHHEVTLAVARAHRDLYDAEFATVNTMIRLLSAECAELDAVYERIKK